jgi:antitoxin (DNA-binding transcriptional repressor) of toxin-antitoxin stability system
VPEEPAIELACDIEDPPLSDVCVPRQFTRAAGTVEAGHPAELIEAARHGEEVVIETEGKTAVKLVLLKSERPQWELGVYSGKIRLREDFNEPLPEDFLIGGVQP